MVPRLSMELRLAAAQFVAADSDPTRQTAKGRQLHALLTWMMLRPIKSSGKKRPLLSSVMATTLTVNYARLQ